MFLEIVRYFFAGIFGILSFFVFLVAVSATIQRGAHSIIKDYFAQKKEFAEWLAHKASKVAVDEIFSKEEVWAKQPKN
jgi:hypothetical protein